MKTLINSFLLISLLSVSAVNAQDVISSSTAVSLCRVEAMTQNSDFVRSKATRIKETRDGFIIKLKVYLAENSVTSNCDIKRDGTLSYSES